MYYVLSRGGKGEFLQRSASFIPSWAVLYKTVCCVGSDLLTDPTRVDFQIPGFHITARAAFDELSDAQSRTRDDAISLCREWLALLLLCGASLRTRLGSRRPQERLKFPASTQGVPGPLPVPLEDPPRRAGNTPKRA